MKKTISIFLFAIIIFSLAAVPLKALASDQERVDVLIYLIDKNINRELKGNKVKTRLMSWKYNIDNTIENLNELLSEVSRIKSSGKKADLPERSGIWLTLKDKEKNYYILSQYRGILGGLKRHIEKGDVQPGSELVDLIDKKIKEMKEMIKKREPLVLLDKMEIESRMETLKEDISDAGREDTIESIQTQLNYSSPINKEYKQEISDLKKLHRQYRRILAYNRGKAEKPNSLALEIPKDKPDERKHSDRKIRFSTYWGKSNYIWRELKVGEWIYPKMQNVSGGSPPYNYTWILDGRVISGSPGTNYRFRNPGMHYLVSRVTDSRGRSSWNSYVYNVQGRSNFNFNYTVSDSSPQRGETVYFRINNTYGGNYPYYFRWEMNGREFDSGKYANYRFRDHGTYRLKVIGRDSYGKTRTQERTFYVGSSGQISFDLQANDNTPSLGQSVQYKFRNIRGGSSPYRYRWRFSTGQTGTSQIFAYRYNKRGTYVLRVTVYDRYNRSATRSYTYRIAGGSSSLRVRMKYSTDRPRIGQTINLSVSSRSGGISPFRYEWYENGRRFATGSSIRRVWNRAGTYRVALKVIDSTGASARTEHNFTVTSGGSINFSEWFSTSSPGVGQTIQMRVQNLKGGVAPYTYYWEMNGRRISTGSTASYRFANSGRHKLRITIKDRIGRTRTREKYFNISSHSLHCNFSWSNNAPRVGDTVTFRATSVSGGVSPYRYRWLMNGRPFSNSATSSYRFNRTGTYRMTAEVRDNSGKIKTTSHTFNVHSQSSSLSFSIRASNSSPRAGQSASFSAVNITGGTAPYSVSWRMNNAGIGSGTNSSYRFSRSGTYRLTATVRDRRGRTKTVSRTFNVQGQTTPLSFSIRASNSSPKAGQSASFSVVNITGGTAPYSVSWKMNNAGIGSGTNSSYRFSRSGTYRLTATVRDRRGRTKTVSRTFNVQGQTTPLSFSIRASNSSPKAGQSASFSVTNLKGGSAPYSVSWRMNNAGIGSGTNSSYRFSRSGTYRLTATVRDRRGRTKTVSRTFNVQGQATPLSFSIRASNSSPKTGQSASFSVTNLKGGSAPYSVSWRMNNAGIGSGTSSSYRFSRAGTYRLTATVRDRRGRTKTVSRTFNVQGQTTPLSFSIRASNSSPKAGQSASFSVTNLKGGSAPYSVSWRMNNAGIGSGTNSSYRFSRSGTYRLTATVRDRRGRTKTVSRTFNVQGQTTPLSFSIRASNSSPKAGQSASFSVTNLRGGTAPYSVSWRMNNAGIGSGTSSSYRFSRAGTYRLTATVRDRNGRTKSASRTFNVRGQSSPLNFSIRASNVRPKPGQTVTFSISRISGGTQPYRYTWTLSRKGTIGGSTSARYTFRMRGSYVITLRVTDSRGQTRSQSLNIKVM